MDLFTIPFQDRFVIYRPRRHLAFIGNQALVNQLQRAREDGGAARDPELDRFLETVGFWRPPLECAPLPTAAEVRPTHAVLLMTNQCNLRCIYCYANAGAESVRQAMPWSVARPVIDAMLANARRPGADAPALTFHGGGEPTRHWALLVRATQRAKDGNAGTAISMSSNGVWSDRQRAFIGANFTSVSLSMDGAAMIQDRQRPRPNGGGTFSAVMESVAALDEARVAYGIRMTVLPESVDRMAEGVRLICEQTKAQAIQVEPTFTSSRGHYADIDGAFADAFADQFLEAWEIGREAGRHVYYSGARPWAIAPAFCLAPLKAMVATADGRLVTCFEVFGEKSEMAGLFTVGKVGAASVDYDHEALRRFLETQERRRAACHDCFCYWHCCGDCATRRPAQDLTHGRCRATRRITLGLLLAYIAEGQGTWVGLREVAATGACAAGGSPPSAGSQATATGAVALP
jgi:uncharacterized protein